MHYTLGFYPMLNQELMESIDAIRREHDPTFGLTRPHVTVLFPVPDSIGEQRLIDHIQSVVSGLIPFEVRFGGFHKSRDHWLFLTLAEGGVEIRNLYRSLYAGILAEYRRDDIEFIPHLGLGLFMKEGSAYDWNNPQESDFDEERFERALQQAKALPLDSIFRVEKLCLMKIPDEVLEWATGKRAHVPDDSEVLLVQDFLLGRE